MTQLVNSVLFAKKNKADIQQPNDTSWVIDVAKDGCVEVSFLQFNADLSVQVNLNGENASCLLNCGYLANKNNKINIEIKVMHNAEKTVSKQQVRGFATDFSDVCFDGQIVIPHNSQQCDGLQSHRGIVLSKNAVISATPQLEIWADDVKCAHGSAIGPLPLDQVFYLQTRGLDVSVARKLLLSSFFGGIMPPDFEPAIQQWMDANV